MWPFAKRRSVLGAAFAAALTFASSGVGVARAGARDLVIVNEFLVAGKNEDLEGRAHALARLLEAKLGWKPNSIHASLFTDVNAGVAAVMKTRPGFALVSAHAYAQLTARGKNTVLASALWFEGADPLMRLVSRRGSSAGPNLHQTPGMTLASNVSGDVQWLNVLFDGNMAPATHFKLIEAPSMQAAVDLVANQKADLALIDESMRKRLLPRLERPDGDLKIAYTMPPLVPSAFLALHPVSRKPDAKKISGVLPTLCHGEGRSVCHPLRIFSISPGAAERYKHLAYKYAHYK